MWIADSNKEQRWDLMTEIAHDILEKAGDFKSECKPPKFRDGETSGYIAFEPIPEFVAKGNFKENLSKLFLIADEFQLWSGNKWVFRITEVYHWDENVHADDIDINEL